MTTPTFLETALVAGRDHFAQLLAAAEPAEQTTIRREWSRFEEAGGESVRAAQVALEAGDRYRAHRLFRAAGCFGDAVRTLDGTLSEILLLDVTPLALGIRTKSEGKAAEFATLIEENTTIPTKRAEMFTTARDFQPEVDIEVFQGQLSPQSKIGQFRLEGIPPAKMGEPKIEVTFEIDANCVLIVTARNAQTGASNSITLTDTTLLTPTERQRLATVFAEQQKQQGARGRAPPAR